MQKFYFTYGLGGHPYVGGWTEIVADDVHTACRLFRAVHPDKTAGLMNCCCVYSEEQFNRTEMSGPDGNFHHFCHERITIDRAVDNTTKKEF